jgi:hypothetical protein
MVIWDLTVQWYSMDNMGAKRSVAKMRKNFKIVKNDLTLHPNSSGSDKDRLIFIPC